MMGGKTPETCWATHKRQGINLWNCCILFVDLFEATVFILYEDIFQWHWLMTYTTGLVHGDLWWSSESLSSDQSFVYKIVCKLRPLNCGSPSLQCYQQYSPKPFNSITNTYQVICRIIRYCTIRFIPAVRIWAPIKEDILAARMSMIITEHKRWLLEHTHTIFKQTL